jgi:hypothetical protein
MADDNVRSADFDSTPQVSKDGVVTLSKDIQAEQKAAGFVPDNQPKSAALPADPVETGTRRDATGNVMVAVAVEAATPAKADK